LSTTKSGLQRPEVEREARAAGLDVARFARALDAERTRKRVDRDITDAWEVGVVGTPTTLVNGRVLVGARPYQELKKLVDEELEAAQRRPG
jgi:predicted DsbA family dithiol-disulfide isomerase